MPKSPTTSQPSTPDHSPRQATQTGDPTGTLSEMDPQDYKHRNSGRRAAGHGGGSLDGSKDATVDPGKPATDYSGGGRGHEAQASQEHEAEEELESRNGPHVRGG